MANTHQFAEDGVSFNKMASLKSVPVAAGSYRPEAFTNSGEGNMIKWGLQIGREGGFPPFLERVDYTWSTH